MAEEILKMVNITKRFAGITALDRVQFSSSKGEVHVLAGENGAGKSTILKILAGIHQADEGEIYFHGKKVVIRNPEQSQKLGIAMVFQELTLVGEMTVWENIYLNQEPVTRLGRINRKEIKKRILDVMDRYGIHIDPDAPVGSLPVAEQQMAEILKILVRDPELIILDEPTSALAKKEVEQLYQIIHNLIADGKTIIFISHRLEELFELGDRITVFKDGCYIGTRNMNEINEDDLIRMMVGRSLNHVFPPPVCEVDDSQVIFEVKNLADADHKLNQVSFQVHKGEISPVRGIYYCQWKAGGHKERGAGHCKRNCPGALRPEEPGADAGAFQPPQPGRFQYEKAHERMFHRQKGGTGIQRVHGVKAFH